MSKAIPNYTESLIKRFRTEIERQLIESEVRLSSHDHELTMVPSNFATPTNT